MSDDATQAVRQADAFHKNIARMFEDMWALVQERGLSTELRYLHAPDGVYGVWSSRLSEHKRLFIFEAHAKFRFVYFLVKVNDDLIRGKGTKYKAVCAALEVDPVAPLIAIWGTFEPRDAPGFVQDTNRRRNWANNTVLLESPDGLNLADPTSYRIDSLISLESPLGTPPWHCEKATFKIWRLLQIRDSHDIEHLIDELFSM